MNNPQGFPQPNYHPAFPQSVLSNNGTYAEGGMSLRDYMAAKAMQAVLTNHKLEDCDDDVVAKNCYQMADFMLKARET